MAANSARTSATIPALPLPASILTSAATRASSSTSSELALSLCRRDSSARASRAAWRSVPARARVGQRGRVPRGGAAGAGGRGGRRRARGRPGPRGETQAARGGGSRSLGRRGATALLCCGRERSGGAERQWRRWRSRGGAAAAAVELPHSGRSAAAALREAADLLPCPLSPALTWRPPLALRPCGWRRASSLVLVSPRSPGARRWPPSSLLALSSSLHPPPSTAGSCVGHARGGRGLRAAVEAMAWRREARPAAAVGACGGRPRRAGRGEEVLRRPRAVRRQIDGNDFFC